jgi:hypothetical protein
MSKAWQITDTWTVQNFKIWQVKIDNSHLYQFSFGSMILFFMLLMCKQHFSNNFKVH